MSHEFWVSIGGERGREWKAITGMGRLPVQSPIQVVANLPGKPEAKVYLLALDQICPHVLAQIVLHLAQKFHEPLELVRADVKKHGVPILAEDCWVFVGDPQKWFA